MALKSAIKDKRVAMRLAPNVYEFLITEAEKRGASVTSMCTAVIGEWKVSIEERRGALDASREKMTNIGEKAINEALSGLMADFELVDEKENKL